MGGGVFLYDGVLYFDGVLNDTLLEYVPIGWNVNVRVISNLPWSPRFSFAVKRRDKRGKEVERENLW